MENITKYFKLIQPDKISDNFIHSIGSDWMLITAGNTQPANPMTASWGAMGVLWNKPIAICFIRPTRYTFELIELTDIFTLNFFPESERESLKFCGKVSGRDEDKIKRTGLTPLLTHKKGIGFQQARLCIECHKIYYDKLKPENFMLPEVDEKFYPKKDYHYMFIGEIRDAYVR